MKRLELLSLFIVVFIGLILLLKSKRFDRFVTWLVAGCPSKTVDDLKQDAAALNKNKQAVQQDLSAKEKAVQQAQKDLETL